VGNLAHFEHKRTLFNMDNTIFSLTLGGSCYSRGRGSNRTKGLSPSSSLTSTTAQYSALVIYYKHVYSTIDATLNS